MPSSLNPPTRPVNQDSCVGETGALIPHDLFSWMKTAQRMRSMEVLSRNVSMGLVRLRTSRNRRSMGPACLRSARVLQTKQVSRSLRREETALRVESPSTKPDRMVRSISGARLAQLFRTSLRSSQAACISFTTSNACGRLSIVTPCRGIGGLLIAGVASPQVRPPPT